MDSMADTISRIVKPNANEETLKEMGRKHSHLYISTIEYETFIVLWLKEFQKDVHFVTGAMPIINQLKGFLVMKNEREVLDICHMIKVNHILGSRFRQHKEHNLRSLIATTISASQHRVEHKLKSVAVMYEDLKLSNEEFFELSKIFTVVCPDFENMMQQAST